MSPLDPFQVFTAHCDAWQVQGRLREPYGGGAAELAGWRLMASGLPYAHLNAACVTDPALADIDQAREWYRSRNLAWGALLPSGSPWPHGRLRLTLRLMAVVPTRFSGTPAPFGLALRRADSDDIGAVVTVDTGAFGSGGAAARAWLEPLCRSDEAVIALGELDGVPVATGYALRCDGQAGPSVYLGGIGVLPAARRRGVAAALSTWLLARGFAEGAGFGHLQTDSDSAARVYARLGFEEFKGIDVYLKH